MQNDTISRSSTCGLFVSNTGTANTSLKMYKCGISNNDGRALQVNNAKVLVSYSRLENNELQSIGVPNLYVCNGGKVYLDSSRVQNNNGNGIDVSGLNSRVSLSIDEAKRGYNTVTQSGTGEIYVHNSATAFLGYTASIAYCSCPEQSALSTHTLSSSVPGCPEGCSLAYMDQPRGGWNNVYNDGTFTGRLINNTTSTTVKARYTYWQTHRPNEFVGLVDTLYQLGSAVNTPAKATFNPPGPEIMALDYARRKMIEWLVQLKRDIEGDKENAIDALHQLALHTGPGGEYQDAFILPWDSFLNGIETSTLPSKLRMLASGLRLQSMLDKSEFQNAITFSDQILGQTTISRDMWLYCQTRKIFASVGLGDSLNAWARFNGIKDNGTKIDSMAIQTLRDYLVLTVGNNNGKIALASSPVQNDDEIFTENKPQKFSLGQSYPNPFNPTTIITYDLPDEFHVVLTVYDILGREIKTLVNETQSAGTKTVTFDGSSLASGVYYYRIEATSIAHPSEMYQEVMKMVLMK